MRQRLNYLIFEARHFFSSENNVCMSRWESFNNHFTRYSKLGFSIDLSCLDIEPSFYDGMKDKVEGAFQDMVNLEAGQIANPDEQRMVGHYWLRNAELAPTADLKRKIVDPLKVVKSFAADVLSGQITPQKNRKFENLLIVGIGGSALGPQFVYKALAKNSAMKTYFFDNSDPQGFDSVLESIGSSIGSTLTLVVSKSGGTPETRNGMLEVQNFYEKNNLDLAQHAVAITGEGSKLYDYATKNNWITIFPMEDWVGGRTSVMSTVGLVPAALQGIDIDLFLKGAATMDEKTRVKDVSQNAAMQLALGWYFVGNGKGEKDMVVLPYKDSLSLFSKYLQQLVMESLGKELDLDGQVVHQGIAVYGNKGSTDQHAYIQQLRDGLKNFFATFIEVRKGRSGESMEVDQGITSADYLQGFLRGTRSALYESGSPSITLSIQEVTPFTLGMLIALFERAVSFYASLVNVNAYHQPGVEAGKKAAGNFLELLTQVRGALTGWGKTADDIAEAIDKDPEATYHALVHLAANGEASLSEGDTPKEDSFEL